MGPWCEVGARLGRGSSKEGHCWWVLANAGFFSDFAQIELRILAHLSGDPELLKLFQEPESDDVFSTLTAQW